jgi:hypothetical protein
MIRRPLGLVALSSFFAFGTAMAGTTCLALLFPSSGVRVIWQFNRDAHAAFQAMGLWGVVVMFFVAAACGTSAIGLWIRARWGYRLAIAILLVNMVGDVGNAIVRGDLRALIGVPFASAMVAYLLTPRIRKQFGATQVAA